VLDNPQQLTFQAGLAIQARMSFLQASSPQIHGGRWLKITRQKTGKRPMIPKADSVIHFATDWIGMAGIQGPAEIR